MLCLCVLSGSLADPIFQNYSAQSKQSSPHVSIMQHCRTCAIVFSHCASGPVHTECLLKNTQATLGAKIPQTRFSVGGLCQWLQQKAKRSHTRTKGNDKQLSSHRPQDPWAKHQSWSCQTVQICVVVSCTNVKNDTKQIKHICIANSMCFMDLI